MELLQDQAVKLTLKNESADIILKDISKSEVIKRDDTVTELLIYWGLEEMTRLNQLVRFKKNLPSPITRDYEWCGLYKPFDHQKVTSEFLSINKKAFCFNEAGTGKTSSVLWAADYLMNQDKVKRVLIVCPLSIMQAAWQSDFSYAFTEDIQVRTSDGLQNQGLTAIYKEINTITDLPASCYSGFTVKVRGDADIAQDDYYVTFETSDGEEFGEGAWVETVGWNNDKSNTAFLTGIDVEIDQTTMPITLKPVLNGNDIVAFKLQSPQEDEFVDAPYELGWRQRKAGDDFTNPMPSFVSTDGSYV